MDVYVNNNDYYGGVKNNNNSNYNYIVFLILICSKINFRLRTETIQCPAFKAEHKT